jgi:hypothetical protein
MTRRSYSKPWRALLLGCLLVFATAWSSVPAGAQVTGAAENSCYNSPPIHSGSKKIPTSEFEEIRRDGVLPDKYRRSGYALNEFGIVSRRNPKALWPIGAQPLYVQACSGAHLAKGLACFGSYCDKRSVRCCRFTWDYGTSTRAAEADMRLIRWSSWISEEPGRFEFASTEGFVQDLQCRGDHCDDTSLRIVSHPRAANSGRCYWTRSFSEERPNSEMCRQGAFVAGLRCSGRYCDNLQLYCCDARFR